MNHLNAKIRETDSTLAAANDAEFSDNRADIIHALFPNLTQLEKYVLATVLEAEQVKSWGQTDVVEQFKWAQVPQAVHQYLEYLSGKEKWEQRKIDEAGQKSVLCFYGIRAPR